jgi:hypothetical protein
MFIGVYGAIGQSLEGTHGIVGKGEVSCLKCHYGKYEEMVSTGHGQVIVDRMSTFEGLEPQPETYACIACHMKRDRWGIMGMTDFAAWYDNSSRYLYSDEMFSLGYTQILFPYGEGYQGVWVNSTATTTSWIFITLNTTTTGASIRTNFTFFDYAGNNNDTSVLLTESSPGYYTTNVTSIYPDYFSILMSSSSNLTAEFLTVTTDGVTYLVADSGKILTGEIYIAPLSTVGDLVSFIGPDLGKAEVDITTSYTALAPLRERRGRYIQSDFADDWNFHTGAYTTVLKMTEVWDNVRMINEQEFPRRGIPIDYMGIVGEKISCASTDTLCHATGQMINLAANGAIPDTRAAYGYQPYYMHTMTLSTASEAICGTCHAPMFSDGPQAHYGVQCYDCHTGHSNTINTPVNLGYTEGRSEDCWDCHPDWWEFMPTPLIPETENCYQSCHSMEPDVPKVHAAHIPDVESALAQNPDCSQCHQQQTCLDCHEPHPPKYDWTTLVETEISTDCETCHGDNPPLSTHEHIEDWQHPKPFPEIPGVECHDCHQDENGSLDFSICHFRN